MYPCSRRMRAHSVFSFEDGISTVSCAAWIPLRMRVRKSAIGSVLELTAGSLCGVSPRRLGHARDEALMGELPEADTAQSELPVDRAGPAATAATGVLPGLVLRGALLA